MRIFKWITYLMVVTGLLTGEWVAPAAALSTRDRYFEAEACYARLQKKPQLQKYRYQWLSCIEKFQNVYRQEPDGPWAAAGLYMAGTLYNELHRRSGRTADRQEAMDHFERIRKRFPQSAYSEKAKAAIADATKHPVATKTADDPPAADAAGTTAAKDQYFRAEACYGRLSGSPAKQKYRDQWLPCIYGFEAAYRSDPTGPWAAASLYMAGILYRQLHQHSFREEDRQQGFDHLRRVVDEFPTSAYRPKAEAALATDSDPAAVAESRAAGGGPEEQRQDASDVKPDEHRTEKAQPAQPAPAGAPAQDRAVVTGLRFWSNPDYTRLVIDADRETEFSFNLLKKDPSIKKPQRLYVDLQNSRLGKDIEKVIPINDDLLKHARAGQYTPESVRVVADIKSFKSYKVFSLKDPFRIVVDMWGGENGNSRPGGADAIGDLLSVDPKAPTDNLAKQLALGVRRIVVDPGHGGRDYGAPGYLKGVHEKNLTLQISKRLVRKLQQELKCEVILTRNSDRYLTLEERTAFANTKNADLFISVHTNANRDERAYGISTYFLNLATDDDAIRVAAMENATSTKNISDLQTILFDLMHNAKINESSRLAAYVQDTLTGHLKSRGYSQIKNKGVKQAPFYVLLGAQMPAILVETSFISNARECRRLSDPKYQERLCEGIVAGIKKYIQDTNPSAFANGRPVRDKNG